MKYNIRTLKLV